MKKKKVMKMNYRNLFVAPFVVLLGLTSCKKNDENKVPIEIQPEVLNALFNNKYQGVLPCGDCSGIETIIALRADSTLSKLVFYKDKDSYPKNFDGTWKLKDSVFEVNFNGDKEFYKIKSDSLIARVGADLKEVKGKLAEDYLLALKQPLKWDEVTGIYISGDTLSESYKKFELQEVKKNDFRLMYTSITASDTCTFKARGIIDKMADEIIFPMKTIEKDLEGDLKIYFTEDFAHFKLNDLVDIPAQQFCDSISINLNGNFKQQSKSEQ